MSYLGRSSNNFGLRGQLSITLVLLLSLLAPGWARAEEELITDRPDQTESAATVPKGSVQIEIGALFSHVDEDGFDLDVFEIPGTLVRIGLVENLELRIGWTGHVSIDEGSDGIFDESGIGDAELGIKYRFRDENGSVPAIAVLVSTSVPVGDDAFTSDELDPSIRFAFDHTLSDRVGLAYNLGVGWESFQGLGGETTTLSSYIYTVALGVDLSDHVGVFFELFGDIPGSLPGGPANSFDGGLTVLLRDNVQLDFFAGVGLSEAADDGFAGVGLSMRFPH